MSLSIPSKINLHRQRAELELVFDGTSYLLPAELLRVCSPSAEVQGHGPGEKKVPLNKQGVGISNVEAQGNYAIRLIFTDGHDSGIYTWAYLHDLCVNQEQHWQTYREESASEREQQSGVSAVKWIDP